MGAAAGDQPGAGVPELEVARQSARFADTQQEGVDVGHARFQRVMPHSQPGLHASGVLGKPADVAGCVPLLRKQCSESGRARVAPGNSYSMP